MSQEFDHIPLNAQIVAKYGTKSVYRLRDGSLLTFDEETKQTFFGQFKYDGESDDRHNGDWADRRVMDYLYNKKASAKPKNKDIASKQSPRKPSGEQSEEDDDPRSKFLSLLPKEFTDWAKNYKSGDALPHFPPGFAPLSLCTGMERSEVSDANEGITTERLVGTVLEAMGLPQKNPFAEQKKNKNDIRKKGLLGREIRDMGENIQDAILSARGLWRDKLNKIRCGPGTAAANRFTDAFGTGCDIPGPVDEAASSARRTAGRASEAAGDAARSARSVGDSADKARGRAENARERADAPRPSTRDWLKESRPASGYATAKVTLDDPNQDYDPYEPVASMRSDTAGRASERFIDRITVSLANRNERKQRAKQKKREAEEARESFRTFAEEYSMRYEEEFGELPPQEKIFTEWARSLGIDVPNDGGVFALESNNWAQQYIGDFPSGRGEPVATNQSRYEAMIDEVLDDDRLVGFVNQRELDKTRQVVKENLDNMITQLIWQMRGNGGSADPDNPEHGTRIAASVPGYLRIGRESDGPNSEDLIYTSVNSFFGAGPRNGNAPSGFGPEGLGGRGLSALTEQPKENGMPDFVADGLAAQGRSGSGMPFHYSISLNPLLLAGKAKLRKTMDDMGSDHLGMDLDKDGDAFLAHTASHELSHVDDFAWRLGQKLGYDNEQEWKNRLADQLRPGGRGAIDLRADAKEGTFLRRQIDQLDLILSNERATEIDKQDAMWQFYMKNVRFDGNVAAEYVRWMRSSGISKSGAQAKLEEIMEELEKRGYSEEEGVPQLDFWRDMVDTPTGVFDPATGTFTGYMPGNVGTDETGEGPIAPDGGARLENAASSLLMSFVGGMYGTSSDWEFMAELRTRLATPGALADIRAFLADSERNIYGLTESQFMGFLAKVVGKDEVMRLRGMGPRRGARAGAVGSRRFTETATPDDMALSVD